MDPRYGDVSEHRVRLGSALRGKHFRHEDPEHSSDPRVRELVEALKGVEYAPPPSAEFRAELRAQLVAVAPRIINESTPETEPGPSAVRSSAAARVRRRWFTRPIAVAAGVAAAFLLLFGAAVWQSQKSLPGDSLYGLKRASENVQLALSSGGTDRGHEYLRLAGTRVEEAQALLRRESASATGTGMQAGGLSPQTASLITTNLASADSDLRHGSDLLTTQAVDIRSQSPISVLTGWAPGQLDRLHALAAALPVGTVRDRTQTSATLTNAALVRARSLAPAVANGCASTSRTDQLGPVPCRSTPSATAPATPHTPASSTPAPTTAGHPGSTSSRGASTKHSTGGRATPSLPGKPVSTPRSHPPTVPSLLPSVSASIGSCGISVGIGSIGVGVGGCPSHS